MPCWRRTKRRPWDAVDGCPCSNRSAVDSRSGTNRRHSDDQTGSSADLDRPTGSHHPGDARRGKRIFN